MRHLVLSLTLGCAVLLTATVTSVDGQDAKAKKTVAKKGAAKKGAAKKGAAKKGAAKKGAAKKAAGSSTLKTNRDKASYAIGLQIGQALKRQGLDIDPKLLAAGIADTLAGKKPALSDEKLQAALADFQKEMQAQKVAQSKTLADKNTKAGQVFLVANGKKRGVRTTKSGLQYTVVTAGKGAAAKATDNVEVHYRGTLIDGKVFDESFKGKAPTKTDDTVKFAANRVIKGWTEALQLMNVGSVYRLVIPSELAYGARGAGQEIGPHAVLIFEVHLMAIETTKKKK